MSTSRAATGGSVSIASTAATTAQSGRRPRRRVLYPFASAGLNVTHRLAQLFDIIGPRGERNVPRSKRQYWGLLTESETAFYRLYCLAFLLVDHTFEHEKAEYMQFPGVLDSAFRKFEVLLHSNNGRSVDRLETTVLRMLGMSEISREVKAQHVVYQGFLIKRGHVRRNWKRRWIVLTTSSIRYYQKPPYDPLGRAQLRGTMDLSGGIDIGIMSSNDFGGKRGHFFVLHVLDDAQLVDGAATTATNESVSDLHTDDSNEQGKNKKRDLVLMAESQADMLGWCCNLHRVIHKCTGIVPSVNRVGAVAGHAILGTSGSGSDGGAGAGGAGAGGAGGGGGGTGHTGSGGANPGNGASSVAGDGGGGFRSGGRGRGGALLGANLSTTITPFDNTSNQLGGKANPLTEAGTGGNAAVAGLREEANLTYRQVSEILHHSGHVELPTSWRQRELRVALSALGLLPLSAPLLRDTVFANDGQHIAHIVSVASLAMRADALDVVAMCLRAILRLALVRHSPWITTVAPTELCSLINRLIASYRTESGDVVIPCLELIGRFYDAVPLMQQRHLQEVCRTSGLMDKLCEIYLASDDSACSAYAAWLLAKMVHNNAVSAAFICNEKSIVKSTIEAIQVLSSTGARMARASTTRLIFYPAFRLQLLANLMGAYRPVVQVMVDLGLLQLLNPQGAVLRLLQESALDAVVACLRQLTLADLRIEGDLADEGAADDMSLERHRLTVSAPTTRTFVHMQGWVPWLLELLNPTSRFLVQLVEAELLCENELSYPITAMSTRSRASSLADLARLSCTEPTVAEDELSTAARLSHVPRVVHFVFDILQTLLCISQSVGDATLLLAEPVVLENARRVLQTYSIQDALRDALGDLVSVVLDGADLAHVAGFDLDEEILKSRGSLVTFLNNMSFGDDRNDDADSGVNAMSVSTGTAAGTGVGSICESEMSPNSLTSSDSRSPTSVSFRSPTRSMRKLVGSGCAVRTTPSAAIDSGGAGSGSTVSSLPSPSASLARNVSSHRTLTVLEPVLDEGEEGDEHDKSSNASEVSNVSNAGASDGMHGDEMAHATPQGGVISLATMQCGDFDEEAEHADGVDNGDVTDTSAMDAERGSVRSSGGAQRRLSTPARRSGQGLHTSNFYHFYFHRLKEESDTSTSSADPQRTDLTPGTNGLTRHRLLKPVRAVRRATTGETGLPLRAVDDSVVGRRSSSSDMGRSSRSSKTAAPPATTNTAAGLPTVTASTSPATANTELSPPPPLVS